MILAILYFVNTIISYFGIQIKLIAHVFVFLCVSFIYLASYVLHFCEYHRMFLHYVVVCDIITLYDYYIGIPISAVTLFLLNLIIAGVFLFIILYLHQKDVRSYKETVAKNNR